MKILSIISFIVKVLTAFQNRASVSVSIINMTDYACL